MTKQRGRIEDFKRLQRLCPTPQHHVYVTVGCAQGGPSSVHAISIQAVDNRPISEYDFCSPHAYVPSEVKLALRQHGSDIWANYDFSPAFMCLDGTESGSLRLWSLREYAFAYAGVQEEQTNA